MTKLIQPKSPETILREALVVARDELKRVNDHYSCVRPDPFGVVIQALAQVAAIPPIEHASEIERRIVGKLVECLFSAGYVITVNDGEEDVLVGMTAGKEDLIWKALASTDADTLRVSNHYINDSAEALKRPKHSFVLLVWGNDADVISDYGVSLEEVIAPANELAESLS